MEEYANLKEMVRIETEVDWFQMGDGTFKHCTWIKEHYSLTSRKGIIIEKKLLLAMKLINISYYKYSYILILIHENDFVLMIK